MKRFFYLITGLLFFSSCQFFKQEVSEPTIARVNDVFLYESDITPIIKPEMSKSDSIIAVNNYINNWATQQLLVAGAKINLSTEKQLAFDKLALQYKNDLYAKAYLEALVSQKVDTVVNYKEAEDYYNQNIDAFRLNEDLIKLRYIYVDKNRADLNLITERIQRYNAKDKRALDSISIQFKAFSLNDSIWVKASQVIDKIQAINQADQSQLLKKSNFIQRNDSIGVYLIKITDVITRHNTAPLEYVRPTINQIVINRRKLELIKQLEKDLTKDAIKNNKFEVYN